MLLCGDWYQLHYKNSTHGNTEIMEIIPLLLYYIFSSFKALLTNFPPVFLKGNSKNHLSQSFSFSRILLKKLLNVSKLNPSKAF